MNSLTHCGWLRGRPRCIAIQHIELFTMFVTYVNVLFQNNILTCLKLLHISKQTHLNILLNKHVTRMKPIFCYYKHLQLLVM